MGQVNIRTSQTSRAMDCLSPWNDTKYIYSILQINLGSNFINKLEVVSALNSFNLARVMYYYFYSNRPQKYNPKVYLGAVQSVASAWNFDNNSGLKSELRDMQKSGSYIVKG